MITLISALTFINLLRITFTSDPITILNSSVHNEEQAALLFAPLEPNEVLPLILFKTLMKKDGSKEAEQILQFPENLVQTVVLYKRMIPGTKFYKKNSETQMFFCPKPNSKENCLVPQEFEKLEPLQCEKEPDTVLQKDVQEKSCGVADTGTPYNIIYQICPDEKEYATKERPIYEICYDTTLRKTLYTTHIILNPLLLKTTLLYRERAIEYPFIENKTLKPLNFEGMDLSSNTFLNPLTPPDKPDYRLQKLVPDTDMAFALWRKPTYQSFNLDWQHAELIPLWNEINKYVKIKAIQMINQDTAISVRTLIYDINPALEDNTMMSNIWVKVVTTMPRNPPGEIRGIVILMNNFISSTSDDDSTEISKREKFIETFCENDFSVGSLLRAFKNVGSRVRCCIVNSKIAEILGIGNVDKSMPMLYITGINSALPGIQ